MAYNTKINLSNDKVCQNSGDLLTLSGDTVIAAVGDIRYASEVTISGDTQLTTKKYVDDAVTAGTIYALGSPATEDVGGITAGTVLTDKSSNEILEEILTPYQSPTFSSFGSEMSSCVEVGTVLSGSKQFTWGFTSAPNVEADSMCIIDVTNSNTAIATDISISSPQSANIGSKTFTSCGQTQVWQGSAKNDVLAQFNSNTTSVSGLYPYYWGICTCPGSAGDNRPLPNTDFDASNVTGGTYVLAGSSGSIGINFNSGDSDYLWFAVPATVANKSEYYVSTFNFGDIGGGVGAGCNLFPDPVTVANVQNNCWSSVSYEVYVSNKQTSVDASMTIS